MRFRFKLQPYSGELIYIEMACANHDEASNWTVRMITDGFYGIDVKRVSYSRIR